MRPEDMQHSFCKARFPTLRLAILLPFRRLVLFRISRVSAVPITEIVGVSVLTALQAGAASTCCRHHDGPVLYLHTFRRKNFDWQPIEHAIEFMEESVAQRMMDTIQGVIDTQLHRPAHLFVVINPYGGKQRADNVWLDIVKPVFERAGITSHAFRTGHRDHAFELIKEMSLEEFQRYDGVVAIGGDGLFQECLRALLALRARGGEWRNKATSVRIAQVPAGSTDTIACTINGCRSVMTAALHIVVGDRTQLDVLEVRTREGECRYACSTASYGFVGDVLDSSETIRWMGPLRYDVSGAFTLARLKSYPVRLWYKIPGEPHPFRRVCDSECQLCARGGAGALSEDALSSAPSTDDMISVHHPVAESVMTSAQYGAKPMLTAKINRSFHMRGASGFGDEFMLGRSVNHFDEAASCEHHGLIKGALVGSNQMNEYGPDRMPDANSWFGEVPLHDQQVGEDEQWRCWEGEVASLMVVVTPTRSDKLKAGIVPHAHLADGRLHIVIVRKCTRVQFFRFLLGLTHGGVDEQLPYVEVKEVTAWRMEEIHPKAQASVWNIDGELVQSRHISARCQQGLVHVFGRGPEVGRHQ
jgi:diacylglycerol kinase family enzyme